MRNKTSEYAKQNQLFACQQASKADFLLSLNLLKKAGSRHIYRPPVDHIGQAGRLTEEGLQIIVFTVLRNWARLALWVSRRAAISPVEDEAVVCVAPTFLWNSFHQGELRLQYVFLIDKTYAIRHPLHMRIHCYPLVSETD